MASMWTEQEAVHLLNRTTFYTSPDDVSTALQLGQEETVRRLIAGEPLNGAEGSIQPIEEVLADGKNLKATDIGDQQAYWLYRMTQTSAPLIEKMTLFWHDHFATSHRKVNNVPLMVQQNELFRKYALGSFYELLIEVGKDPAMVIWLDGNSNKKGKPNENYAREVMELFTLGIGNYSEQDIKEAARAFTGWSVNKDDNYKISFNAKQHDTGVKKVLRESGSFDEHTVVDVLFHQAALSQHMASKLLQAFATADPPTSWVDQIAKDFKESKTVGEVLKKLFLSDTFYKPEYQRAIIKSPAEYVAWLVRAYQLPLSKGYTSAMRKMGQELYLPPDVSGWEEGTSWLMTTSLLARYQFAESVAKKVKSTMFTEIPYNLGNGAMADDYVWKWSRNSGIWFLGEQSEKTVARYAEDTFLYAKTKINGMRGLLQLLLISPEAQMK
jgi:uncharacterized protein (DUF1800 family)